MVTRSATWKDPTPTWWSCLKIGLPWYHHMDDLGVSLWLRKPPLWIIYLYIIDISITEYIYIYNNNTVPTISHLGIHQNTNQLCYVPKMVDTHPAPAEVQCWGEFPRRVSWVWDASDEENPLKNTHFSGWALSIFIVTSNYTLHIYHVCTFFSFTI